MATFQEQVQDLTSLTVSDTGELSQFLKDGVIDVTNRWLAVRPQDIELFGREATISDSQGVSVGGAKIISVIREAGADGSSDGSTAWEPCKKIPSSMQSRVVDSDSLSYASAYHPVYTINSDKTSNVYPVPSSNNGFKVFYVNEEPRDISNNAALIHSHSNIKYFPNDKVYLVVMYTGIRLLNSTMSNNVISLTSAPPDTPILATVSFTAPTAPTVPSDPSISSPGVATIAKADISGDVPTYTKPSFSDPGVLSITAVPPDTLSIPSFTAASVSLQTAGSLGTAPTYTVASQTFDIAQFETFLETEEDSELAQVQLGRLQHELGEYQADIQNNLNEFNEDNAIYQSTVKEALQELQIAAAKAQKDADFTQQTQIQEYASKIQKYQADLAVYQAEVGAQVQEYTQKLQRGTQQYQLDMQNELNEFNKENARYQANIKAELAKFQADAAEALKEGDLTLQAAIQDYTQELALFSGEVQKYQSETQSGVQTMQGTIANNQALLAKYQAETAEYQAEIAAETQEQSIKMQQYQLLYKQLKAEYDQAFMIAAPKQQPKQQVRT